MRHFESLEERIFSDNILLPKFKHDWTVLAVLVALALVTRCCYFCGRRQRQSRARHTELLRSIVVGANKTISSHQRTQSGAYPSVSSPGSAQASSDAHSSRHRLHSLPSCRFLQPSRMRHYLLRQAGRCRLCLYWSLLLPPTFDNATKVLCSA